VRGNRGAAARRIRLTQWQPCWSILVLPGWHACSYTGPGAPSVLATFRCTTPPSECLMVCTTTTTPLCRASVREDLVAALNRLWERRDGLDHIIIETTGEGRGGWGGGGQEEGVFVLLVRPVPCSHDTHGPAHHATSPSLSSSLIPW
jgi:hypothetical protein